jgi:exocyst complex component 4
MVGTYFSYPWLGYHQAFAASLPHHASIFSHLELSQAQVKEARAALLESKEALGNKRADLVQIWSRGETIEEMIRILDQMYVIRPCSFIISYAHPVPLHSEHLKNVADVLESLISEKRFLQAAVILVRSLKMVNNPDMQEVGALADIRGYLISQETVRTA